jgi:ribosome-binding protein aMBF1 (putative translation factor)
LGGDGNHVVKSYDIVNDRNEKFMNKKIPKFRTEEEKRDFWSKNDSSEYLNWENAERAAFPNLKPSKNIVGKYIKKIREQRGLTQEQLAIRIELAGWRVTRFLVSRIERGDRQVSDVEAQLIGKVLKVSVASLFGEE